MKVKYTKNAASDIKYWKVKDKKSYLRIKQLIDNISKTPYEGIGKPEPLKYNLTGKWSRRVTREHRLVYEVIDNEIIIYQCRFHY